MVERGDVVDIPHPIGGRGGGGTLTGRFSYMPLEGSGVGTRQRQQRRLKKWKFILSLLLTFTFLGKGVAYGVIYKIYPLNCLKYAII